MANRAWFETTTPQKRRELVAADWRRRMEAGRFRASQPSSEGTFSEHLQRSANAAPAGAPPRPKVERAASPNVSGDALTDLNTQTTEFLERNRKPPSPDLSSEQIQDVNALSTELDTLRRNRAAFVLGMNPADAQGIDITELEQAAVQGSSTGHAIQSPTTIEDATKRRIENLTREPEGGQGPLDVLSRPTSAGLGALAAVPEAVRQRDPRLVAGGFQEGLAEPSKFRAVDAPIIRDLPETLGGIDIPVPNIGGLADIPGALNLQNGIREEDRRIQGEVDFAPGGSVLAPGQVKLGPLDINPKTTAAFALETSVDPLTAFDVPGIIAYAMTKPLTRFGARAIAADAVRATTDSSFLRAIHMPRLPKLADDVLGYDVRYLPNNEGRILTAPVGEALESVAPGRLGFIRRADELDTPRVVGGKKPSLVPTGAADEVAEGGLDDALDKLDELVSGQRKASPEEAEKLHLSRQEKAAAIDEATDAAMREGATGAEISSAMRGARAGKKVPTGTPVPEMTLSETDNLQRYVGELRVKRQISPLDGARAQDVIEKIIKAGDGPLHLQDNEIELMASLRNRATKTANQMIADAGDIGEAAARRMEAADRSNTVRSGGSSLPRRARGSSGGGPPLPPTKGDALPTGGGKGGAGNAAKIRRSVAAAAKERTAAAVRAAKSEADEVAARNAAQAKRAQDASRGFTGSGRSRLPVSSADLPPSGAQSRRLPAKKRPKARTHEPAKHSVRPERTMMRTIANALSLPRAIKTSFDLSGPGRQGVLFITRPEWWKAWRAQYKALRSGEQFAEHDDWVKGGPRTQARAAAGDMDAARRVADSRYAEDRGLSLTGTTGDLNDLEEAFQTQWAEHIIGVRASEQAYVAYLNELRTTLFDNAAKRTQRALRKGDITPEQALLQDEEFAKWVNIGSGRGDIAEDSGGITRSLLLIGNRTFFSPRLNIARIQAVERALSAGLTGKRVAIRGGNAVIVDVPRAARLEIARDTLGFIGSGVAAATGLSLGLPALGLPGIDPVELDPRNTDFGKFRMGVSRLDPWGGWQQWARFTAQFIQNTSSAADSGNIRDLNRMTTVLRFARGKLDPGLPALVVDMLTGETFLGEDIEISTPGGLVNEARRRFMPLFFDDLLEAYEVDGWGGAIKAAPGFVGVGINTFRTVRSLQNDVARELFPDDPNIKENGYLGAGGEGAGANSGQRGIINDDPRIAEALDGLDQDYGSDASQLSSAFQTIRNNNQLQEEELKANLDAGMEGKTLRSRISDMKSSRYDVTAAQLENPRIAAILDGRESDKRIEDIFAERYWSADLPEDPRTGRLDWDARQVERDELIADAIALGIDPDYITGSGEGTFRGTRYDDPDVRAAVEEQEEIQFSLQTTGFNDIDNVAWDRLVERVPELGRYGSFSEYRATSIAAIADGLLAAGEASSPANAADLADQQFQRGSLDDLYSSFIAEHESEWAGAAGRALMQLRTGEIVELQEAARRYEYFGLNEQQRFELGEAVLPGSGGSRNRRTLPGSLQRGGSRSLPSSLTR